MSIDHPTHILQALPRRRFLVSAWPWRSLVYLVTSTPQAFCAAAFAGLVALPWVAVGRDLLHGRPVNFGVVIVMAVTAGIGITVGPIASVGLAALERRRLGIADRRPVIADRIPPKTGPARWMRRHYDASSIGRDVVYATFLGTVVPAVYFGLALAVLLDLAFVLSPLAVGDGTIVLGIAHIDSKHEAIPFSIAGILFLPVLPYLFSAVAGGQAALARLLLDDGGTDAGELREVARSRSRLVDAYEAERRRIERDLHDGAQHRLTSLALQIGLARLDVPDGSPAAVPLTAAHDQAKALMVVLRDIVHGIRPASLTELGLAGAVREIAATSAVPVTVTSVPEPMERLPERVESVAWFAAAEALTNVAKHARASRADVTMSRAGDLFVLDVVDDGTGGADPSRGTGLTGLADRVAAVGGRLLLSSPPGGPSRIRVEIPCAR